ncbi:sugar ABC transporter ATP-binding protein [Antiquaquibacter soli]|uniref:Sugar ABC transporter ATP-binding protein n=1 Tax=Antiquaquibacter soli TaxID=3064523 RepID=A0ABT9BM65_9MICO|nr:sugar ABC transporter ATP-binding protein [Protaetiibacter sp. WY-16]MDO7881558.1 sugar ABC transporter ATP-binding protein [Protaetiibacter sp. WY-16]
MTQLTLSLRDISKSFGGVEVLHQVNLDAVGGEVLALLGENGAGKSTLVKILAGDYTPDGGTIVVDGAESAELNPRSARRLGIRMIHQEFQDAGALTVAENISLGRWPGRGGVISWSRLRRRAEDVLGQMGVDIDPGATVGSLRVGERQIVEIARALADDAQLLILDEPTAALSQQEVDRLFEWVRRLRDRGVCIVYITHRLDEVFELADRVQVLRNGDVALVSATSDVTRRELVEAMVGRDIGEVSRPADLGAPTLGEPLISIRDLEVDDQVAGLSLDVSPGEVVCLYGKLGSGTTQVAEACFGIRRPTRGQLRIGGVEGFPSSPVDAIRRGVGYLPPDRKREGAFMNRTVVENLAAASWSRLSSLGVILARRERSAYDRWSGKLGIKSADPTVQAIANLSGGNQQKVLLARWLERGSNPLVLVEPTRGVDVGARQEIYSAIRALSREGQAVLVVTSDYEEAVQLADRVVVMQRGRQAAEFAGDDVTAQNLTIAAGG